MGCFSSRVEPSTEELPGPPTAERDAPTPADTVAPTQPTAALPSATDLGVDEEKLAEWRKRGGGDLEPVLKLEPGSVVPVQINGRLCNMVVNERGLPYVVPVSHRLVIYSSNTPDIADFSKMLKCHGYQYNYGEKDGDENAESVEGFKALLARAVKEASPGGMGFKSIAFACHGPEAKKDGGSYDKSTFEWEISERVRVTTAEELREEGNPVRELMQCLANATVPGGRVDLLACNLLQLDEGKKIFAEVEAATKTNFAASCDLTGNPTAPDQNWVMESDNIDIFEFYFAKDEAEAFEGNFLSGG